MSGISIQPAKLTDANIMAELHGESFGAESWSAYQLHGSLALSTTQGWLVTLDDTPIGFILCQVMSDQSEILTFCISQACRYQGIGRKLLDHVLNALPPGTVMYLEVAADNHAARRLYENCGFAPIAMRPGYYRREGVAVDAISYRLVVNH